MTFGFIDVLDASQTKKVIETVDNLSDYWFRRKKDTPFYTLGASTYQDAHHSQESYHSHKQILNPILLENFSWVYDILLTKISENFGKCELISDIAYPGFHIVGHKLNEEITPEFLKFIKDLNPFPHMDLQYRAHERTWNKFNKVDYTDLLSLTLALELPKSGGGLNFWGNVEIDKRQVISKEADEIIHLSMEKIKGKTPNYIEYEVGKLFYHKGHTIHQINKGKINYGDRRITLQSHAIKCDGIYKIYF